jgi:hypothetical protein
MVRVLLRLEGIAIGGLALHGYARLGAEWGWFALLYFAPDLSIAAYPVNVRTGGAIYNLVHTYLASALLLGFGWSLHAPGLLQAGLLLAAHIGVDRALGFGLKYPTTFRDTHLQRV